MDPLDPKESPGYKDSLASLAQRETEVTKEIPAKRVMRDPEV